MPGAFQSSGIRYAPMPDSGRLKPGALNGNSRWFRSDRLLERILRGASDADIPFDGMCQLLTRLGFHERIRGDHHIFTREGVEEILNLQPKGTKAKPYQVRQVRNVIVKYRLAGEGDD